MLLIWISETTHWEFRLGVKSGSLVWECTVWGYRFWMSGTTHWGFMWGSSLGVYSLVLPIWISGATHWEFSLGAQSGSRVWESSLVV